MNYLIICEFDGRGFEGWQSQPNRNTLQDKIEEAIGRIQSKRAAIVGAGRTDAGVSGYMYPFSFKTDLKISDKKAFLFSVNSILDKRIYLKKIVEVSEEFSARFSCKGRTYRYRIYNGISPLKKGFVWQTSYKLNIPAMKKFIEEIKGKHDFSTFCRKKSLIENPIVNLTESRMEVKGKNMLFTFTGDRFLHNMIRFLVGTSVYIGRGKITQTASELLNSKDVHMSGKLVPPEGLIFYKAYY